MSTSTKNSRKARSGLPEIVTKSDLADVLAVTPRHLQRLAAQGVVVRAGDGYDFSASIRSYLEHALDSARRRRGSGAEEALRDARVAAIERKMAREDRALTATVETVDGIDVVVSIFNDALDELAVRLAPFGLPDTSPVLAEVRGELAKKRDEAVRKLMQG